MELVGKVLKLIQASEQLQVDRKKMSREIGAAKKAGQAAEPIIAQVATISGQISELDDTIAECMTRLEQNIGTDEPAEPSSQMPEHFRATDYDTNTAAGNDLKVSCEQPFPHEEWQTYVKQHSRSTAYHDARWHQLIYDNFGHNPHYLIARQSGRIVGVLPLIHIKSALFGSSLISLPYVNYSGVLADDAATARQLPAVAQQLSRELGASHVELRDTGNQNAAATKTHKVSMILPLPTSDEALDRELGSKLRAQVKRASSHGLIFKFGGEELVSSFYQVFSRNMRDLGTPVYSRRFFSDIIRTFPEKTSIAVVYQGEKPLAAGFLIAHNDKLEIPWASSLREFNHLGANMFLYRSVLAKAIELGHSFFDFGRSSIGASTHKFKRQWGAQEHQLYWHYWLNDTDELPEVNPQNPKYQLVINIWKRLPVALANFIGPHVAKNLP